MKLIETMRYAHGRFRFLNEHIKRLRKSAVVFGIAFSKQKLLKQISLELPHISHSLKNCRVRVELSADSQIKITFEPFKRDKKCRIALSLQRVDSQDMLLQYKTTLRELFDSQLKTALKNGLDDVLFLNELNHVTQGCIHNVFIRKNGRWKTPPLSSGVLPGIMRSQLLRKLKHVEEINITKDDLLAADGIMLCNSLRGIRRAELVSDFSEQCSSKAEENNFTKS